MRGLLLYGELTGQHEYIDTVAATYRKTVRTRLKPSGFISHDMDKDRKGETTSPGDAAQLALWLAARHGYAEFFDDVERIVRARLLPCQITATPGLKRAELAPLLAGRLWRDAHRKPRRQDGHLRHYGRGHPFAGQRLPAHRRAGRPDAENQFPLRL